LWNQLEARKEKLTGAGKIHRFNRDVEEALSRIQEKYSSIPEELGRDTKAVQSYIKKHDGFENELVALEAQVILLLKFFINLFLISPLTSLFCVKK
jgi:spectrin beta